MSETERPTAEALERELSSAVAVKAERDSLVRRSAAAQRQCAAADTVLAGTAAALASESADVAKLESLSLTRVLASLRGGRATALDAERDLGPPPHHPPGRAEGPGQRHGHRGRGDPDELPARQRHDSASHARTRQTSVRNGPSIGASTSRLANVLSV